jgi:hypothetical protein
VDCRKRQTSTATPAEPGDLSCWFRLNPFSADRVGGLGFVPSILLKPIVVSLILSAISIASAFFVHHSAATTPVIGVTIILSSLFAVYLGPTLFLREDIVALKR